MIKVSGEVISGKRKGQKLGFPTANIIISGQVRSGIYAGKVVVSRKTYKSAIFVGPDTDILEAYIFDFAGDIYGKNIAVEIDKKIRDAKKFKNNEELKAQIKKDIKIIKNL